VGLRVDVTFREAAIDSTSVGTGGYTAKSARGPISLRDHRLFMTGALTEDTPRAMTAFAPGR